MKFFGLKKLKGQESWDDLMQKLEADKWLRDTTQEQTEHQINAQRAKLLSSFAL